MEEQAEDRESTKSDVKLGRLQFRIDYDFSQSNVSKTHVRSQLGWYWNICFALECLSGHPKWPD